MFYIFINILDYLHPSIRHGNQVERGWGALDAGGGGLGRD